MDIILVTSHKFSHFCPTKFCPIRYSFFKGFNSSWSDWQLGSLLTGFAKFTSVISLIPYLRYVSLYLEYAIFTSGNFLVQQINGSVNTLSANITKWSNTLKQFVGNLPTYCFSVFDHLVILALKGLMEVLIVLLQA